jgi:TRAP transporter TAXI family solute receptor
MRTGSGVERRALLCAAGGAAALSSLVVLSRCEKQAEPRGPLRIATGPRGGVYYRLGEGLAGAAAQEYPGLRPAVLVTAASATNVALVDAGQAEVGFAQADVLIGTGLINPLALARLHEDYLHLVVRADSGLRSLSDLRGRLVSLGPAGSGTEVTAQRLLSVAGTPTAPRLTKAALNVDAAATALERGDIAAFFFSGGLPVTAIASLRARVRIRLINLGQYVEPLRVAYGEVYAERGIPASTYEVEPVVTVGVPNYLVVAAAMADDTAYGLTRLLLERRDTLAAAHPAAQRFNRRSAIDTAPLNLHPGAARYFRDSQQ